MANGSWFGAFLLHVFLIDIWIMSPFAPIVAIALIFGGYVTSGATILALIAAINLIRFPYMPSTVEAIHNLDMAKYYQNCELRGALDQMASSKCLYCFHPHGILSVGFSANGIWSRKFNALAGSGAPGDAAGGWRGTLFLVADNLRKGPFSGLFKILCDVTGRIESASKAKIQQLMREKQNIAIIPGGFQDATLFAHGKERTAMSERKGLIKYALEQGYKLYPIYTFGESQTFWSFTSFLHFRLWLNKFNIPAVAFVGEPLLPILPLRSSNIYTYVGPPLQLPTIASPTDAQVSAWHAKYIQALVDLFEANKAAAGYPDAKLEIW
ncbi:hypothetical protein AB1Y20_007646 [Prymnesium parvum]|uniref:Acyltransferase n=1 Tax=Prymnesium parvum TaxID=97485 RepID=A0AB34IW28_PRYPA